MRERQKPIAQEELDEFVEPSIAIVESNITAIEEAEELEWINTSPRRTYDLWDLTAISQLEIQLVFAPADPFLQDRITAESPRLFSVIDEHNQLVGRFSGLRQRVMDEIESPVRIYLEEEEYGDEFEEDEIEILLDAIIKRSENYGHHQEFWDSERDDLLELARESATEAFNDIEQSTQRYLSTCESLENELQSRKRFLKNGYGIVSEFNPDEDTITYV